MFAVDHATSSCRQWLKYLVIVVVLLLLLISNRSSVVVDGLSFGPTTTCTTSVSSRRWFLDRATVGLTPILFVSSSIPFAGIFQPNDANAVADSQFIEVGRQERAPDGETPFVTLSNGVQIKDYRIGDSDTSVVRSGSRIELTIKGRLLNLNGVIFYDTKSNDPNGFGEGTPLVFTVGQNVALPGLESGILGMKKGGIRRIIVPADVGYGSFPNLEPQPMTDVEKRSLDSVIKNPRRDQTVMFDVKVERIR